MDKKRILVVEDEKKILSTVISAYQLSQTRSEIRKLKNKQKQQQHTLPTITKMKLGSTTYHHKNKAVLLFKRTSRVQVIIGVHCFIYL